MRKYSGIRSLPFTPPHDQFDSIRALHHLARVRKSHLRPHKYRSSRRVRYNMQIYSIYPIYLSISRKTAAARAIKNTPR